MPLNGERGGGQMEGQRGRNEGEIQGDSEKYIGVHRIPMGRNSAGIVYFRTSEGDNSIFLWVHTSMSSKI
jgi:hypothetical protein